MSPPSITAFAAACAPAALAAGLFLAACTGQSGAPGGATTAASATAAREASSADALPPLAPETPADAASVERDVAPGSLAPVMLLDVPRAPAPIEPTGHFRVELWGHAANTHTLLGADGRGAVPVNEARFLWGDGRLYLFFYAGDLDLQAHVTKHDGPVWNDDSVAMTFGGVGEAKRIVQISVTGVTADGLCPAEATSLADPRCDLRWESGVRARTDADGTLNAIGDRDEEWAVEAAIPLASLRDGPGKGPAGAGTRVPFSMRRCEMAHDGPRACGAWGEGADGPGVLVLGER